MIKNIEYNIEKDIETRNEITKEDINTNQKLIRNASNSYNTSNQITTEELEWVKHVSKMLFRIFRNTHNISL